MPSREGSGTVVGMARPLDPRMLDACIEGVAATHQQLLDIVDTLSPQQMGEPSFLPGWSRITLLGHLTLNARSYIHVLASAARGEVSEQYPGGATAREAAIREASGWSPETVVSELRKAIYMLEGAWAGASYEMWNHMFVTPSGATLAVHEQPFARWRECVVHLTDLDVGVGFDKWPDYYVRLELDRQKMMWAASHPMGLTQLPAAALALPEKQRLAWLLQRTDVDGLPKGPGI